MNMNKKGIGELMGYNTQFNLQTRYMSNKKKPSMKDAKAKYMATADGRFALQDEVGKVMLKYKEGSSYIDEILLTIDSSDGDVGEFKWYTHEKEMKYLSKKIPSILFILTGHGEENGDIWRKFFVNGVMSGGAATITFPEYEEVG